MRLRNEYHQFATERSRWFWAEECERCRRKELGDDQEVAADVASAAIRSDRKALILCIEVLV